MTSAFATWSIADGVRGTLIIGTEPIGRRFELRQRQAHGWAIFHRCDQLLSDTRPREIGPCRLHAVARQTLGQLWRDHRDARKPGVRGKRGFGTSTRFARRHFRVPGLLPSALRSWGVSVAKAFGTFGVLGAGVTVDADRWVEPGHTSNAEQ